MSARYRNGASQITFFVFLKIMVGGSGLGVYARRLFWFSRAVFLLIVEPLVNRFAPETPVFAHFLAWNLAFLDQFVER
jgi:hypothetical protein